MHGNLWWKNKKIMNGFGMSQTDLAKVLGYSEKSGIARVETGRNRISSKLVEYVKVINTTVEYLI